MTITCFIRYEIEPFKKDQFTAYAENWACIIPRVGGHLLGYFVPPEGSNYEAWNSPSNFPQPVPASYLQAPADYVEAA